jgi:formyl-CoA transferase
MRSFEGVTVLDFTQVLAGPFATLQLAHLGARVIKIEQPGTGDMTRGLMPNDASGGLSPSFVACNLGKESLTLNLKSEAAGEIVFALVERADVVVENFKPGVMQRLGFSYAQLSARRPDLVYCSISGYGQDGPKAPLAAFDGAIQAASGMMAVTGHPSTGPTRAGYFAVDMSTGLNAAFAIAAALYRRAQTGEGEHIDVAMLDTATLMIAPQMNAFLMEDTQPELIGNQSPTRQPTADVFATRDGHVQVIALREPHVEALFAILGIADRYREFDTPAKRLAARGPIGELVARLFAAHPTQHWLEALLEVNIPVSAVRTIAEAAADPQLELRNTLAWVETAGRGRHRTVFAGHTASDPTGARPAPALGEHTASILAELGYDADAIARFTVQGAV